MPRRPAPGSALAYVSIQTDSRFETIAMTEFRAQATANRSRSLVTPSTFNAAHIDTGIDTDFNG